MNRWKGAITIAICNSSDIQPLVIILVLVFVLVLDMVGVAMRGWLYPLMGSLLSFISVGIFSGSDQTIVTSQVWSDSASAFECNGFPAYPLMTILFVLLAIASVLIMWATTRSSYGAQ